MTGLGWSAVTMASHVAIILSVILAFLNAVAVRQYWRLDSPISRLSRLEGPIFAMGIALIVERSYYVCARLLVNTSINLWEVHPAPEMLSAFFASSIYWLSVEIRKIGDGSDLNVRSALRIQRIIVVGTFFLLVGGLF